MVDRSGRDLSDFLPRRFYRYAFELTALLDLRENDARLTVGLTDGDLGSNDLGRCQAVGEAAHYLGHEGVLAPSATGAGTVLAVFVDRLAAGSYVNDVDYETYETSPGLPDG